MSEVYAFYLPQFHEIEENNKWWGKGFTEWTNIRNATPETGRLKPLNDHYYNLLDKDEMVWQANLAKQYKVSGFCFYHYWFKNSRTIMERPAENLLRWTDVSMKFFFCWANHTWKKTVNGKEEVLIHEYYGDKKDWEDHFQYLLPFFKDSRYKKINNKPVFMLYNVGIPRQDEMTRYFKKRAVEEGFNGIYFIDSVFASYKIRRVSQSSDAVNIMMPSFVKWEIRNHLWKKIQYKLQFYLNKLVKSRALIETIDGDRFINAWFDKPLMKKVRNGKVTEFKGKDIIYTAITMWDNTYRHHFRGSIITRPSREKFKELMSTIRDISNANGVDLILINAWNEWAEGMILEPDTINKDFFLNVIKEVFGNENNMA